MLWRISYYSIQQLLHVFRMSWETLTFSHSSLKSWWTDSFACSEKKPSPPTNDLSLRNWTIWVSTTWTLVVILISKDLYEDENSAIFSSKVSSSSCPKQLSITLSNFLRHSVNGKHFKTVPKSRLFCMSRSSLSTDFRTFLAWFPSKLMLPL